MRTYARSRKRVIYSCETSNPSSGEFQDRIIDGRPLYEHVGEKVAQWGAECMGDEYSYIGAVVGATYPEMGKVLRKIMTEIIYSRSGVRRAGRPRKRSCSFL